MILTHLETGLFEKLSGLHIWIENIEKISLFMLKLRILEFPLFETSGVGRGDNISIKANNRVFYCEVPEA